MATFHCPEGHEVEVKPVRGQFGRYETLVCREHEKPLMTGMQLRAKKSRGAGLRKDAEPQPIAEAHAEVEARNDYIYWHELDDELKIFCKRTDARYGRPGRQSIYTRLQQESPPKTKGAALAASGRSST